MKGFTLDVRIDAEHKLKLFSRSGFDRRLAHLDPGNYWLTLERKSATRTAQANRYYWGVVLALLSEHTGYETEELHEYFKKRFNPVRVSLGEDEQEVGASTAKLNIPEFYEYVEKIRRFAAAELQVAIPDPNGEVAA